MSDAGRPKRDRIFRSPYDKALGLVFLPRLIDKMRAAGTPALEGFNYKTIGMDKIVLTFLELDPDAMESYVLEGHGDEDIFEWVQHHGRRYSADEARTLNHQILDRGQRTPQERQAFEDRRAERYPNRLDLQYYVDLIEADESGIIPKRPLRLAAYEPE